MDILVKAFSTLDLGSSNTTGVEVTVSTPVAQVNAILNSHSPTSSSDHDAATSPPTKTTLPPQARLLGLPQELRDQIYGYLTEEEERIILGWRFVETYKRHYPTLSYENCFNSAIALHPLSMTCKRMLTEFQPVLLLATKIRWTLLVNNFDLEQLQFFRDYINTGVSIKPSDEWLAATRSIKQSLYSPELEYNVQLCLRYQMDNNAVSSVTKLRDFILSSDPDDHNTVRDFHCLDTVDTEFAPRYHPRTGVSPKHIRGMTEKEAGRAQSSLRDLEEKFWSAFWLTPMGMPYDNICVAYLSIMPIWQDMGVSEEAEGNGV